jgi:hypothetical protein
MTTFHGKEVSEVRHRAVLNTLASGTFTWRNNTGSRVYIQKLDLSPSGTLSVYVQVNGQYWTQLQQGTGTGIGDSPVALDLVAPFLFNAMNENEEIEVESNATVTVQIASGTGSVQIALVVAEGVEQ